MVYNAVATGAIKGLALLITLATLPAYVSYFHDDRVVLGVWLTGISVVTWILTFDFGVGNGLRNSLVHSLERQDGSARGLIAGAYGASLLIAAGTLLLCFLLGQFLDLHSVMGVPEDSISSTELQTIVFGLVLTVVVQSVLRIVTFLLYALQRSALTSLLALCTSGTMLLYVVLGSRYLDNPDVMGLLAAYFVCVNAPMVAATVWVFLGPLRGLAPTSVRLLASETPDALRSGRVFFLNQILFSVIVMTGPFLVAHLAGPASVIEYQAFFTIFTIASMVLMLTLTPVWSAVTQALAAGDRRWILRTYTRVELLGLAAAASQIILALRIQTILDWWLGPGVINVVWYRALAFALFGSGFVMQAVVATFASGTERLRIHTVVNAVGVVVLAIATLWARGRTEEWVLVPLIGGCIFWAYYLLQRRDLLIWLRQPS